MAHADKRGHEYSANGVAESGGPVTARLEVARSRRSHNKKRVEGAQDADETAAPRDKDASGNHGAPRKSWTAGRGNAGQNFPGLLND